MNVLELAFRHDTLGRKRLVSTKGYRYESKLRDGKIYKGESMLSKNEFITI